MNSDSRQSILIVEDSDDDYFATERAFKKSCLLNPVYRCTNGDQALDFLFRRGVYADSESAPRPGMILLDLNLPGTDGRDVLGIIKSDQNLNLIPVIVLTTSDAEQDVARCYAAGANSYVKKPVNLTGFVEAIARLKEYWLEVALLPKELK
jgi:CheY-like chemotaxis protein